MVGYTVAVHLMHCTSPESRWWPARPKTERGPDREIGASVIRVYRSGAPGRMKMGNLLAVALMNCNDWVTGSGETEKGNGVRTRRP